MAATWNAALLLKSPMATGRNFSDTVYWLVARGWARAPGCFTVVGTTLIKYWKSPVPVEGCTYRTPEHQHHHHDKDGD
jgi:hypothetical protein